MVNELVYDMARVVNSTEINDISCYQCVNPSVVITQFVEGICKDIFYPIKINLCPCAVGAALIGSVIVSSPFNFPCQDGQYAR